MEPYEKVKAEEAAQKKMRDMNQQLCKNSELRVENTVNDYKTYDFQYQVMNDGCPNDRRNGSAWCQSCSDKHKSI